MLNKCIRLGWSLVMASLLTALSCLLYTLCRDWLLQAIESHAIAFLENFDFIGKMQEKFHMDTIPTIWQLQEMFFQIGKIFLFWLGMSVLLLFMPVKEWRGQYHFYWLPKRSKLSAHVQHLYTSLREANKFWLAVILLLAALQFALSYTIIYNSWWSGDDFYCTLNTGQPFYVRYLRWIWCSNIHVARGGELFFYLFPLTPDRWVHLTLTPLLFALFPVAVKRLVLPKLEFCSPRGAVFYFCAACMIYLGARFSTYCCFSGCSNYIYGTIFVMLLLPYYIYRVDQTTSHSWVTIGLFCLCTNLFGLSTEGIAVVFTALLGGQLLWRYFTKKSLPPLYYLSLITFWMGVSWLLFTPGAAVRGMNSPMVGGIVPYNLYGLPLLTKLTYLPELFAVVWRVTHVALLLYAAMLLYGVYVYAKTDHKERLLRQLWVSLAIVAISMMTAVAYIAGAVPNGSTFTPCSFGLISAVLYLAFSFSEERRSLVVPLLMAVVLWVLCVRLIVPSLSYSMYLKPYELQRNARIQEQIAAGKDTIRLPYPYPADYDSTKTDIPQAVKISEMAVYFNVKAIKEEGKKVKR